MEDQNKWRTARFKSKDERSEFILHAQSIGLAGVEIEALTDEVRVRFRAPAKFEIGLAGMVEAHGGKVVPSTDQPEAREVRSA